MGAFGVIIGILQYVGLYIQLNAALIVGQGEVDNHVSGNAPHLQYVSSRQMRPLSGHKKRYMKGTTPVSQMIPKPSPHFLYSFSPHHLFIKSQVNVNYRYALFTEVPHDITTQSGEDVEMACSFRGAGSPSYSLEIQWWYIKDHRDWQGKPAQITNNVVPLEETSKDATKISVVKVAGSNISHKLRLSSVKRSDEGTYECRVIDFSGTVAQQHRVRAYLHVEPERSRGTDDVKLQKPGQRSQGNHPHPHHQTEGRQLKRRSAGTTTDCNESCVL